MTALRVRQPPYGRRAWTIDADAAFDLDAAAANATTEETFALTGLRDISADLALWARTAVSPAGVFFSHTRRTGDDAYVVATANSTGAPVDPGAEAVALGPMYGGLHASSPSGPLEILSAGSGTSTAGNVAANESAVRSLTPGVSAGIGNIVLMSPRLALPAGIALDQGIVNAGGGGLVSVHNLTGIAVDPGTPRWDWVVLRQFVTTGGPLDALRPRVSGSGPFYMRRFRLTLPFAAGIAAGAVGEASGAVAPRTAVLVSDETSDRISVVHAVPTAALPAGFAVSHARVSAENVLSVGLGNVSGAGPTAPGDVTFDLYVFTPPSR